MRRRTCVEPPEDAIDEDRNTFSPPQMAHIRLIRAVEAA